MKLTIDTNHLQQESHFFTSKEQYDQHPYSSAGYDRFHAGTDVYAGGCNRFHRDPTEFPCLMIETGTWDDPTGPYTIYCAIISGDALISAQQVWDNFILHEATSSNFLDEHGAAKTRNLIGGITGWRKAFIDSLEKQHGPAGSQSPESQRVP